jgi:hypothetical protein
MSPRKSFWSGVTHDEVLALIRLHQQPSFVPRCPECDEPLSLDGDCQCQSREADESYPYQPDE